MQKIVAYLRVSTDEQHLGPQAQRAGIERWAAAQSAGDITWFEDHGVSGGAEIENRPGLAAALAVLRRGDVLIVAKRDRLARDMFISLLIERTVAKRGARIVSVAGEGSDSIDPSAQLMRRVCDAFSEHERALIRARTRAAMGVKKLRGERVGQVPYGHQLAAGGVMLERDELEQAIIERVRALRERGTSLRAIVATLNDEAVPARGRAWHLTTVQRLLVANAGAAK